VAHGVLEVFDPPSQRHHFIPHASDPFLDYGVDGLIYALLLLCESLHERMRFLQLLGQPSLELL
jgi:hypothetical protein